MRFIMKLFKVLIIVTLIMLLGYVIEERKTIFMRSDNKVPQLNQHTSEEQKKLRRIQYFRTLRIIKLLRKQHQILKLKRIV